MISKRWIKNDVENIAKKYSEISDFNKNDPKAYSAAVRNGWLNDVTKHILRKHQDWTDEKLKKEALKYNRVGDFNKFSKGAYLSALRRGILNQITSHYDRPSKSSNQLKK